MAGIGTESERGAPREGMRFAILGAGAMGSVFGGRLALAGHDVTLVDVWSQHVEAVERDGLALERDGGEPLRARPRACAPADLIEPVDVVIVLTKGFATTEAATSIRRAVMPRTWVVTLQNGLGLDRALAAVFGPDRVVPGTTTVGAEMLGPGRTKMAGPTATGEAVTHLGRPRTAGAPAAELDDLANVLTKAELPTEVDRDADGVIWTKLAMAASMAPVCAVLRCTIGEVWGDERGRALIRALVEEIVAVAAAEDVELDREAVWRHCASTWDRYGDHHPSMAVDVMAGRRTEIDSFSLEIARRAEAHGDEARISRTVGTLVALAERAARPA